MSLASELALSTKLVTGMLTRLGKAVLAPNAPPDPAYVQRVQALIFCCAACSDQPGCAALQATVMHMDHPPKFCGNAQALRALPKA